MFQAFVYGLYGGALFTALYCLNRAAIDAAPHFKRFLETRSSHGPQSSNSMRRPTSTRK